MTEFADIFDSADLSRKSYCPDNNEALSTISSMYPLVDVLPIDQNEVADRVVLGNRRFQIVAVDMGELLGKLDLSPEFLS